MEERDLEPDPLRRFERWFAAAREAGLHAPEASHLLLLEAVAGADLVRRTYDAALSAGYLWHEFGDSSVLLP